MPSIPAISLFVPLPVVAIHLGFLSFRGDLDPKNTNVVTQNTSDEEDEAAAIISDAESQ